MNRRKKNPPRRDRPSVRITESPEPPGCLPALSMLAVGLWIALYPHPYRLAMGVGVLLPLVAYLVSRHDELRNGYIAQFGPNFKQALMACTVLPVGGLVYRQWRDFALLETTQYIGASVVSGAVLCAVAQRCRAEKGIDYRRWTIYSLYMACVLALANSQLDDGVPVYVQGYVTEVNIRKTSGKHAPRYFTVTPYLRSPAEDIKTLFRSEPLGIVPPVVRVGDPVCSVLHEGRLGFEWYERRMEACPAPAATSSLRMGKTYGPSPREGVSSVEASGKGGMASSGVHSQHGMRPAR